MITNSLNFDQRLNPREFKSRDVVMHKLGLNRAPECGIQPGQWRIRIFTKMAFRQATSKSVTLKTD